MTPQSASPSRIAQSSAEGPRSPARREQVRRGRRRDRHEDPGPDGLDDPRPDEDLERAGHPGEERPEREQPEAGEEERGQGNIAVHHRFSMRSR